jgi:hypothetical protein
VEAMIFMDKLSHLGIEVSISNHVDPQQVIQMNGKIIVNPETYWRMRWPTVRGQLDFAGFAIRLNRLTRARLANA